VNYTRKRRYLPVDEDFHRAVGEALGYSEDAIERFIKLVTNPKIEREQRRLAKSTSVTSYTE